MLDPQAECPECSAKLGAKPDCRSCGWKPSRAPHATPEQPAYVPPWKRPGWKDSKPEDPCGEPGCSLTIRDHIEAFKKSGQRMLQRVVRL